jgi:hypothetical protein
MAPAYGLADMTVDNARHPIVRIAIYAEPHRSRIVQCIRRPAKAALIGWVDGHGRHHERP